MIIKMLNTSKAELAVSVSKSIQYKFIIHRHWPQ